VATGSLGQGQPIAVGIGLAGRYLDRLPYHVWALCGDSEVAEGSVWEALDKASFYRLGNVTTIIDVNRLGQRGETEHGWHVDVYRQRAEAFGAHTIVIDGHDVEQIDAALGEARRTTDQPTVIVARTVKGRGVAEIEDHEGWHGKALPPDMAERAIAELGGVRHIVAPARKPEPAQVSRPAGGPVTVPTYTVGEKVATRRAYGDALRALGARPEVIAMDGEVSNSTHAEEFKKAYPDRFFEMYIAEQMLVAAAVGNQRARLRPVRLHVRGLLQPRLRLHPHGRHLAGEHPAVGLPRRRRDRPGRPVADGPGGPGRHARGAWLDRPVPERTPPRRPA